MGRRLVLFPLPYQGHLTPMLQLASILYSKGFSISIIHTEYNSPNPEMYPYFTFHPFPVSFLGGNSSVGEAIMLQGSLDGDSVTPFRDFLAQLVAENVAEEPVACLITDVLWYFTQTVSESLNLPRLVLCTFGLSCNAVITYFPVFREKCYLSYKGCQLEEIVPELPPLKMKDIPVHNVGGVEANYRLFYDMLEKSKASRGLIFNSFEELEGPALAKLQQDIPVPLFVVGPFHNQARASSSSLLPQERGCITWLNAQAPNSVLYISFGSLAGIQEADFLEIAWGLTNSKQPFLWAMRPGLVRGFGGPAPLPDGLIETIKEQGHIVEWVPQDEVLSHPAIGGFLTHSGWNSTLESICEGVPMLCLPCFGDQMVNARYVTDVWKLGLSFENGLRRENIEKAIKRLMVENHGTEMKQRSLCWKEKANFSVNPGGSSQLSLESLVTYILSLKSKHSCSPIN